MNIININDWRSRIFESDLTPKARLVALALAKYYRENKECYPSYSTLREDTGYTNNHTIGDAIKELVESGFIKVLKGKIKNLSVQTHCYKFIGVSTGVLTGEETDEPTDEPTGEVTGEVTGAQNELEIENKRNREIKEDNIYSDKSQNLNYSFVGKVIKLNQKNYEEWQKAYPDLNLYAELLQRDRWLQKQSDEVRKNWFLSTAQYFIKQNALRKAQNSDIAEQYGTRASNDDGCWF